MSIVYRSDVGRICAGCRRPIAQCACKDTRGKPARPGSGVVRVSRVTQGRGGKAVSVITGLPLEAAALAALARELKQRCGSGGTVREGMIEIQGEHRDTLVAELVQRGYAARRAGG
ncbi:MAG TPA: translation initiation factor Sui1 [Steroidobacteraceae bacterium]|nr:translation initiation factor Sui1 [Steroidobacteraceae bacterium]